MMQDDHVRWIQQQLRNYGYGLAVDGWYGSLTDAIVRRFQATHGLATDGVVGPATWHALWPGEPASAGDKYGRIRQLALAQVGKPYVYGAEVKLDNPNPLRFDCSELIEWLFYQVEKIDVGDWTVAQERVFTQRLSAPEKPGDVFYMGRVGNSTHMGIYVGNGQVVEARGALYGTIISTVADIARRGGWWRRKPNW